MGRVRDAQQMVQLTSARTSVYFLQKYAVKSGAACRPLVQLLLSWRVDHTSAIDSAGLLYLPCSALDGLTPLHLLACCSPESAAAALRAETSDSFSRADLDAEVRAVYSQHLAAVADLLQQPEGSGGSSGGSSCGADDGGADVNARTRPHGESPLTYAAYGGAYEVAAMLLEAYADPNLPRFADDVRPLDLAVAFGRARLACLLIDHCAQVMPDAGLQDGADQRLLAPELAPEQLLLNAVSAPAAAAPHKARLVELLLQHGLEQGLGLEEVNERGETALHAAVAVGDAEVVKLLVDAGANLEATVQPREPLDRPVCHAATPLAAAAVFGKLDIMQILLDAGADPCSYINEHTGYDMVQNAANGGQFEAVVKLVEAGASWRLARGHPRVIGGSLWYVPEILSIQKPGLKVRLLRC
ncbi:ankyrin repeat-containing domain protein [Scenedesmus sp. NREL 46B-D3]|nr:ankyrin repeat-containing domain protein [Scenedesmus sp. NREL 46B-D3]